MLCVRCYAFDALIERKNQWIFSVLLHHLKDTAWVRTLSGCIGGSERVGDYFLAVGQQYFDASGGRTFRATLDSILIFDPSIMLDQKKLLLHDILPREGYYERIREIATKEENPRAILALARYRNQSDTNIFLSYLRDTSGYSETYDRKYSYSKAYFAVAAAQEFPHPSFYPYLVDRFEREWKEKLYDYALWKALYLALAEYPRPETYALFERLAHTTDPFRYRTLSEYLLLAIAKYPNPMFESLKVSIK